MEQVRILCVDDERNVLRALERMFIDNDYEILCASSGEEGLELLDAAPQVQVVISDYRMPGMNGVDFLKEVYRRHPETIRIVLSGYADTAAVVAAINEGKIYRFVPKPWNDDELRMTVAKALETFALHRRNVQLAEELRLKDEELAELAQQKGCLLQLLDGLPVGVIGLGKGGKVLQINVEAAQLLGLPRQEVLERGLEMLPPELCTLAQAIGSGVCGDATVLVNGAQLRISAGGDLEQGEVLALALTREG